MKQKVLASITVYHPERERLWENIRAILPQVDGLILIVNGKDSLEETEGLVRELSENPMGGAACPREKIRLLVNERNLGVAAALNQALREGEKLGADWVLTLDQDSVAGRGFVEKLMAHSGEERVGIICPRVRKRNGGGPAEEERHGWHYVLTCITSGSLTNVGIWRKVGGFEEKLFIDYVDHEYCARLIRAGYAIIRENDAELVHEIGKPQYRKILGLGPYPVTNHPAIRRYYLFRNLNYFCYKYPELCRTVVNKVRYLRGTALTVVLFEDHKIEKLSAMARGWMDYRKMVREEKKSARKKDDKKEMET